jgi:hypothetical protein
MEEEKEKIIIELLKQTKTYSQIQQQLHVSSRDISHTKKRYDEEQKKLEEEQKKVQISKTSQALSLFEQGNTPVQVAVELDMELGEVDRIYKEYSESNGLHDFNQVNSEIKNSGSISGFIDVYQLAKQEGMTPQRVIDGLKIAEEIPFLEAKYQHIKDNIDLDRPRIFESKRQKESLANELKSMLDELQSFREYRDNQLKSIQEELESAREDAKNELKLEQEKLDKQKAFLASELNNCKEGLLALRDADNQLKFIQKEIDKLKQEKYQLTSRVELLNNEELEILKMMEGQRRRKEQEQDIQELQSQSQPPLKQQSVFIALAHELHTQTT